jgi:hypothetical protein
MFLGSGPIYRLNQYVFVNPCKKYWWTTVTFINNFYPGKSKCLGQLWYLSNDMLYFLFLPFVVLAYINNRKVGYILSWLLLLSNFVATFINSAIGHHNISDLKDNSSHIIYTYPHARYGAYTVGVIFGIMYYEFMKSSEKPEFKSYFGSRFFSFVKASRAFRWSLYLFSSSVMLFLICIQYSELKVESEQVWPQWLSNIFNATHRSIFVIGLALFLAGPMVGKTPLIRFAFGGSAWAPWAKITFMAYLVHTVVIVWIYLQAYQAMYFTKRVVFYIFVPSVLITYL